MVILGQRRTLPFIYLGLSIVSYPIWFSILFSNALRIQQNAPKFLHVEFKNFWAGSDYPKPLQGPSRDMQYSAYSSVMRPSNDGGLYHLSRWACHLLQITVNFLNASAWDETNVLIRLKKTTPFCIMILKISWEWHPRTPFKGYAVLSILGSTTGPMFHSKIGSVRKSTAISWQLK